MMLHEVVKAKMEARRIIVQMLGANWLRMPP